MQGRRFGWGYGPHMWHGRGCRPLSLSLIVGAALLLSLTMLPFRAFAQAPIGLQRDKEKTVYTIGSDSRARQEEAAEREKAWEMLKSMGIIVDQGKRQPTGSQSGQPGSDR
jgi:hypothetical protein